MTDGEMGELVDAARQRARQTLEVTIAPFRDHIERVHLVKGMLKKEIAKFAAAALSRPARDRGRRPHRVHL